MLDTNVRGKVQPLFDHVAKFFIARKVSANQVTILAFVIGLIPGVLLCFTDMSVVPVLILWLSGLLDAVDGTIARLTKSSSLFGTIMDITFDRIVEIGLIVGLLYRHLSLAPLFVALACSIIISMTIFLTVAAASEKASEKSFYYQPGLAERTEGFLMFSLIILLPKFAGILIIVFTLMIIFTALQRFIEAYRYFTK